MNSGTAGDGSSSPNASDVTPTQNKDETEINRQDLMKAACELIPPGRTNRKLRGHLAEVKTLREAGYSISGIQQVLAATGIQVGRSVVAREVSRLASSAPPKVAPTAPEKTSTETVTVTTNS